MKITAFSQWTAPYGSAKPDLLAPVWGHCQRPPPGNCLTLSILNHCLSFDWDYVQGMPTFPVFCFSHLSLSHLRESLSYLSPWLCLALIHHPFPSTSNYFRSPRITVAYSQIWEERPQETKVVLLRHAY